MALLNPAYGLILPFLFIFTVPIAIFATMTTIFAFSILLLRVILIYIELALAVIPHYLIGTKLNSRALRPVNANLALASSRRKKRRSSSSSVLSGGSITPVAGSSLGLSQSVGPTRDYEGVGGWRLGSPSDDDALPKINSHLELPADHGPRHRRSLTSGSGSMMENTRHNRSFSPEAVMNTSRGRTPPSAALTGGDGYFPQVPSSPRALKRTLSVLTGASGSSGSSKGSSVLTMKQR